MPTLLNGRGMTYRCRMGIAAQVLVMALVLLTPSAQTGAAQEEGTCSLGRSEAPLGTRPRASPAVCAARQKRALSRGHALRHPPNSPGRMCRKLLAHDNDANSVSYDADWGRPPCECRLEGLTRWTGVEVTVSLITLFRDFVDPSHPLQTDFRMQIARLAGVCAHLPDDGTV